MTRSELDFSNSSHSGILAAIELDGGTDMKEKLSRVAPDRLSENKENRRLPPSITAGGKCRGGRDRAWRRGNGGRQKLEQKREEKQRPCHSGVSGLGQE